jgi:hypothetical protein
MHQKADCQEYMLKTSDESMTVKNVPISMFTPSVVQFSDIQSVPYFVLRMYTPFPRGVNPSI